LEQIQLLLGHASVQTPERYLGTKQNLAHAHNGPIQLTVQDAAERSSQTKCWRLRSDNADYKVAANGFAESSVESYILPTYGVSRTHARHLQNTNLPVTITARPDGPPNNP
jgi:hypothetical protein